jgi:hypothetical protein
VEQLPRLEVIRSIHSLQAEPSLLRKDAMLKYLLLRVEAAEELIFIMVQAVEQED